jgi:hypothetical protein
MHIRLLLETPATTKRLAVGTIIYCSLISANVLNQRSKFIAGCVPESLAELGKSEA